MLSTLQGYRSVQPRVCTDRCPVRESQESAVLSRLLTQTIEAPKRRNMDFQIDKYKKKKGKRMIDSE